jgi:hypothetical protein
MSIKGFNNQKGLGNSEFLSVLSGGSDKKAIPTLGMGVYPVLAATAISSVTRSTDEKTLDIDFGVATSARKGDILRMVTGTLPAWEFEIIIIVSANVVRVWNISPSLPLATETASILRPVTLQLDSSGNITVTPAVGGATEAKQDAQIVLIGGVTEVAPATDTASSGLNGRLQRIAQRITSLIALLPASLGQKTAANSLAVILASDQTLPLPSGAATSALQTAEATLIGDVVEAAPATDTASSGLNGRLQRIAQRITSMIALLPASIGQKAKAASLAVSWSTEGEAQIGSITEVAPAVRYCIFRIERKTSENCPKYHFNDCSLTGFPRTKGQSSFPLSRMVNGARSPDRDCDRSCPGFRHSIFRIKRKTSENCSKNHFINRTRASIPGSENYGKLICRNYCF